MASDPLLITDSDISGVLKNLYQSWRTKAFPLSNVLLANIEKTGPGGSKNAKWGGNGVYFDVVLTRPVGMTASASGYFPPSAAAVEKQANIGIKRLYVNRRIDGLAIVGTQSKEAAFVSLGKKIIEEANDAARLGMQEVVHGDGSAIKAVIGTVNSTTSIVVSAPYGITGAGRGGLLLDAGMYVAVLDASSSYAVLGRATISSVTSTAGSDNATVVLDTAVSGMAASDILVPATTSDTAYGEYPVGVTKLLNRGGSYNALQGLDPSTTNQARWNTIRADASAGDFGIDAAAPSEFDIWELIQRVAGVSGKDAQANPGEFLLITTPGLRKKFAESFFGQRQWTMTDKVTLKGGFSALQICGVPMVSDNWCPAGTVYLIHKPSMTWVDAKDWGQVQYESAGAWRFVSGRDAFETNWACYMNLGVVQRNSHGMITGYTDTNRYDHVM